VNSHLVERVALGSRAEQRQRGVDGERRRAGACESPADDGDEGKGRPHVVGREQRWGVSCRPLNRERGGEETGERELQSLACPFSFVRASPTGPLNFPPYISM
jgi:hypothetical protein